MASLCSTYESDRQYTRRVKGNAAFMAAHRKAVSAACDEVVRLCCEHGSYDPRTHAALMDLAMLTGHAAYVEASTPTEEQS